MFCLSFTYRFEAAHRFTLAKSEKCMTPHGHSWRATLDLASTTDTLDEAGMVAEFSTLKRDWKILLDQTLDHSFFAHHLDPLLPAMRAAIPNFRELLFPGDPTTETLALLLATKAQQFLTSSTRARVARVSVQETETNRVTFDVAPSTVLPLVVNGCTGWWADPDPAARGCIASTAVID